MHRVYKFSQKARLKLYIDIKTELRRKCEKWVQIRFFQVDE